MIALGEAFIRMWVEVEGANEVEELAEVALDPDREEEAAATFGFVIIKLTFDVTVTSGDGAASSSDASPVNSRSFSNLIILASFACSINMFKGVVGKGAPFGIPLKLGAVTLP